jgi:two-component system, chemotaxis family, chemotaxis protein CheY
MAIDRSIPILVVDDSSAMIAIVRNLLRQIGYENVKDATSAFEALERLANEKFELIISDWNMQPITGYELLRNVRADARFALIPFIMMTAEGNSENVIAAKFAGVSSYIIKPFTADNLKLKIEYLFNDKPLVSRAERVIA